MKLIMPKETLLEIEAYSSLLVSYNNITITVQIATSFTTGFSLILYEYNLEITNTTKYINIKKMNKTWYHIFFFFEQKQNAFIKN